jgi:hypothetical protein
MGEEQIQQEEQVQEEQVQEEPKQIEEGPAVKILRQKLEQEIKTRKQLEEELEKTRELLSVSDIGSLMQKVERLELETIVAKKYPELSDEIENILQFRRTGETIEDTILRYIGKKTIENKQSQTGFSLGSNKLTSVPSEPKGDLTKEEAEQLFKKLYYPEE